MSGALKSNHDSTGIKSSTNMNTRCAPLLSNPYANLVTRLTSHILWPLKEYILQNHP